MYDNNFYEQYKEYLKEPIVRKNHDWIFSLLNTLFYNVVDLGCGTKEFKKYSWLKGAIPNYSKYIGIDLESPYADVKADYRTLKLKDLDLSPFPEITTFVSLFSTELTADYKTNYLFYQKLFEENPTIKFGLVSGFYYSDKKDIQPVREAGDIVSYQTLEPLEDAINNVFSEKRIILATPSQFFGPNVIEVWKLFERQNNA